MDMLPKDCTNKERYTATLSAMDAYNSQDPNTWEQTQQPREQFFAKAHLEKLFEIQPSPSEALAIAAYGQHIGRWKSARSDYPEGRKGYLKWREELKKFHANTNAEILEKCGYDEDFIARVRSLNLKKNMANDEECQTLEDTLCLVFLTYQLDALIDAHEEEKMISIIKKTAAKMGPLGLQAVARLKLSNKGQALLQKAIG